MTLAPIGSLTPQHQATDTDEKSVAAARKAAQEFESIFLRQLLGALEKSGGLSGSSHGAAMYKSMLVGALADKASESGGIGIADVVFKAMLPPALAKSAAAKGGAGVAASGAGSAQFRVSGKQ